MADDSRLDFLKMEPTSSVAKLTTKLQCGFYVVIRINTERYVI